MAFELKSKEGRPSKLQKYVIDEVNKANGFAVVVYPDNMIEILKQVKVLGGLNDDSCEI